MNDAQAERWITVSAVIVAGIYAYRRFVEPAAPPATVKKLAGIGELPPLGSFATAWGFMFLAIAIVAQASPALGGSFAILIATGDLLTNSASVFADVGKQENAKGSSSSTGGTSDVTAGVGSVASAVDPIEAVPLPFIPSSPVQSGVESIVGAVDPISVIPLPFLPPPISIPQVPILTGPMHGGTF